MSGTTNERTWLALGEVFSVKSIRKLPIKIDMTLKL